MNHRRFLGIAAVLLLTATFGYSASIITINFDSGGQTLTNGLGSALSGGTTADGDGDVLQLGYFTGATAGNNFAGTWVPLTGEDSLNNGSISGSSPGESYNQTSIGDLNGSGGANGKFALSLTFTVGDPGTGNSLPSSTTIPLAIRFYNGTTIETSTLFNTVSDNSASWLWLTPVSAPNVVSISISLNDPGLVWQGGSSSAFETALAVPEPAGFSLALFGGIAMLIRRRRKA